MLRRTLLSGSLRIGKRTTSPSLCATRAAISSSRSSSSTNSTTPRRARRRTATASTTVPWTAPSPTRCVFVDHPCACTCVYAGALVLLAEGPERRSSLLHAPPLSTHRYPPLSLPTTSHFPHLPSSFSPLLLPVPTPALLSLPFYPSSSLYSRSSGVAASLSARLCPLCFAHLLRVLCCSCVSCCKSPSRGNTYRKWTSFRRRCARRLPASSSASFAKCIFMH